MRYLGTCDGNMQEGSLRADVNVSGRKKGSKDLGTRCEIKNVNSIKFMEMAIEYEATILVSDIEISKYFEEVTKRCDVKLATNWIIGELFSVLNDKNLEITQSPVSSKNLSKLINLIKKGTISGKIAKTIFELMIDGDKDPEKIVTEKGLKQESDPKALEKLIDKVIDNNREKATEYKSGKVKLFGFFVGQVMKESSVTANPHLVNEILKKKL